MPFQSPAVDAPPQPWTGRYDGDGPDHRRWWQAVNQERQPRPLDAPGAQDAGQPVASGRKPVALLGFASDEGVRRNKGRTGAAAAPAALRSALGPLAFHLDRTVADHGNVVV